MSNRTLNSFEKKKFFSIFLKKTVGFIFLGALISGIIIYKKYNVALESAKSTDRNLLELKKQWFETMMKSVVSDLQYISNLPSMKIYLAAKNGNYLGEIENNFVALANSRGHYSYIKFIDESGIEKLVIHNSDQAYALRSGELRNDSEETFFKQTRYLSAGRVFVSDPELAAKNGEVEVPARPLISVSTPLFNRFDIPSGIVVIILDAAKIFEKLNDNAHNSPGSFSVLTKKGIPLISGKADTDWSILLKYRSEDSYSTRFPQLWSILTQGNEGVQSYDGYLIYNSIFVPGALAVDADLNTENLHEQNLYLKIFKKTSELQIHASFVNILKDEAGLIGIVIIIVFFSAWYVSYFSHSREQEAKNLHAVNHHYNQSQKISSMGSWWYDIRKNQYWWSEGLYELLGLSGDNILPDMNHVYPLVHPEEAMALGVFETTMKSYLPHQQTFRIVLPGGKTRHIYSCASVELDGKEPVKISGILHDITKYKNTEENLRQLKSAADVSNEAKTEYITNIGSEIKDTMQIAVSFSETLISQTQDVKTKNTLRYMNVSANFLINLCDDIIELSNLEVGHIRSARSCASIYNLVDEIRESFSLKLEQKSLKFFIDIDPEVPENILMNVSGVRHILANLISNAVKFTEKGFVLVTCRKKFRGIEKNALDLLFTVEDTGIAFTDRGNNKYLKKFAVNEVNEEFIYSMGIAVSRRLVYLMHGDLEVLSESGKGCVIKIRIPDLEVSGAESRILGPVAEDRYIENISLDDFSKSKILLVGSEEDRSWLKHYFYGSSSEVIESPIERSISYLIEKELPDIIIMVTSTIQPERDMLINGARREDVEHIPLVLLLPESARNNGCFSGLKKTADEILFLPVNKQDLLLVLARYLPFRDSGDTGQVILDLGGITDEGKKDLSGLLHILQNKLGHLWEKVSTLLVKNDIDEFVAEVIELGRKYNYRPLYKWGNELRSKVQINDTMLIVDTLREYPEILENLNRYGNAKTI